MGQLVIRPLQAADAQAYFELRLQALETEPSAFGKSAEEHNAEGLATTIKRFEEMPKGSFILGAFVESRLVGIAMFSREGGIKERHKGHIYGVFVAARYRRQRIAFGLLTELLAKAAEDSSLEQILISVSSGQEAAKQLYRKLGFARFGAEPRALKIGAAYIDEDQMVKFIARRDA